MTVPSIKPAQFEPFTPFGRSFYTIHPFGQKSEPSEVPKQSPSNDFRANDLGQISSKQRLSEKWKLYYDDKDYKLKCEELYSKGKTVIWSHGASLDSQVVVKTFTVDSDVMDYLWCSFTLPSADQDKGGGESLSSRSLCVFETEYLNVFNTDGSTYTEALPFPVQSAWSIPGGLLLQRAVMPTELTAQRREVPTLFSLLHPLDEPRPVTSQAHGKTAYICDPTMNVLFTCDNPPIVMMYDSVIGLHSIWILSKAVPEDVPQSPCTPHLISDPLGGAGIHHPSPVMSVVAHSRLLLATPTHSPFRAFTPSPASRSHMQSPVQLRLMSPALGQLPASSTRSPFMESPLLTSSRSPAVFRSPPGGGCREESFLEGFEPLVPEICLRLIWQEAPTSVRHGAKGQADKIFLTTDVFGNMYLCFLIQHTNKLRILKMLSSDDSKKLVFVPTEEIQAKDVISLKKLAMLLVLGLDSSLTLYSGPTKACTIHLPSIPVTTTIRSAQGRGEELMLSPTRDDTPDKHIADVSGSVSPRHNVVALQDPHPFGCNLVLSDGSTHRLVLPKISESNEVSRCINALKCLLPSPIASQFILGYYHMVNHNSDRLLWQLPDELDKGVQGLLSCLEIMLGYGVLVSSLDADEEMKSDSPAAKKSKTEQDFEGDAAWEWLLKSDFHHQMSRAFRGEFPLASSTAQENTSPLKENHRRNEESHLLNHVPALMFALHLVYEDFKLDVFAKKELSLLGRFLYKLSRDFGWESYTAHYCRDFPYLARGGFDQQPTTSATGPTKTMKIPEFVCKEPPSIHEWLTACLRGETKTPYPLMLDVCKQTFHVTMMYSLFAPLREVDSLRDLSKLYSKLPGKGLDKALESVKNRLLRCQTSAERVVVFMAESGLTAADIDRLPSGVAVLLREAIHMCRKDPPFTLSQEAYAIIGREDLAAQASTIEDSEPTPEHGPLNKPLLKEGEKDDGMEFNEEIMKLRFGKDLRVQEVRRLLQSSKPVRVSLTQKPEVSDHDFIQEQETKLLLMCKRTMALSVGRGMFTMATSRPVLTETLPIPPLELTGRAPPRNTIVGLDHVDTPNDMKVWPQFHNGVAAGLRIAPDISQIDSTWIVYNKPKELTNEHAGFLMALGLNGHLDSLSYMNLHDYLCKGHELTTVGLLLGIASARRGSMHLPTTKVLSIHVDALLPPTSAELDVPHSAQVAGVLGIGLVYQGTAHRRMAEVLLSEIGRPAGPEMENAINRESYSLAAGLSLGLVMLQHGNEAQGVADLKMADQLYQYMVGGQKKPQTGTQKEKFKSPSYLIKEGETVNIDVTAPGATLALGFMFMKTNNRSVASWLDAPDTQFLLDSVRPDFLLLRLLSRGLIMWDSIVPSQEWIASHIPTIVMKYAFSDPEETKLADPDIDLETLSQAKANIIAGCCLALGMRFAGSANQEAFTCLMHASKSFKTLLSSAAGEQAGKPTLETCLSVVLLSLSLVMAGTGNLEVLRIVRQLHKRHSADVPYGSHMAVHMALGLLFLGGGRYTLSSTGPSVAALVCALYPKFPISSTDNRYHLQAFRHLYALAAEPRVLVTREVETREACYVPLEITLKSSDYYQETVLSMTSPCIIPELHLIKKISVVGPRYLPINIDLNSDTSIAKHLSKFGTVFVKRRAGYLSYADDPKGYRNLLARTFPEQSDKTDVVRSFSSEPQMVALAGLFCDILSVSNKEKESSSFVGAALHECITEEKPDSINFHLTIKKAVDDLINHPDPLALWEMKLVFCFYDNAFPKISRSVSHASKPLLSEDFISQCKLRLDNALDQAVRKADFPPGGADLESHPRAHTFSRALPEFTVHHGLPVHHKDFYNLTEKVSSLDDVIKGEPTLPMSAVVRLLST